MQRIILFFLIFSAGLIFAQEKDLTEFSLQDLTNVEVTLVSKKKENLFQAAAAVYVLTDAEIQSSGVTSIPEALRLVPGIQVARIDANKWAITSRGFIGRFSNKLLVLIDGRVIYNQLFSGVFWDMHDVMLEDVDRIEVIRGPGATLWGANAVNGVINIVTKHTIETKGVLIKAGAGSEEKQNLSARYGGQLGNHSDYRGFIKTFKRDAFVDQSGKAASDDWTVTRGGIRWDWEPTARNQLSFMTDGYTGQIGHRLKRDLLTPPYEIWENYRGKIEGFNFLGSWQYYFLNASVLKIMAVHDLSTRDEGVTRGQFNMSEIDVSYLFDWGRHHQVILGGGYRLYQDWYEDSDKMTMIPSHKRLHLTSAFLQDDFQIIPNHFRLTLGSKFEHNSYTGFEIQPNLRLLFMPYKKLTLWGAVSRAVRTPARANMGGYYIAGVVTNDLFPDMPIVIRMEGNPAFRSETLLAYELGGRLYPSEKIYFDCAAFYNQYDHLFSGFLMMPFFSNKDGLEHAILPLLTDNRVAGNGIGLETLSEFQVSDCLQMSIIYSITRLRMHVFNGSTDYGTPENYEKQCPLQMFTVQSHLKLPLSMDSYIAFRYMDELPDLYIPDYWNMDVRLSWRPVEQLQIALVGQNLLHASILEFKPELDYTLYTYPQRSVYATLEFKY
jgi:iron complex outermembrane receptor protein